MPIARQVDIPQALPLIPSDADRAKAVDRLHVALSADRMTLDDFEEWVSAVYRAATLDELRAVAAHIPAPREIRATSTRSSGAPITVAVAIGVLVVLATAGLVTANAGGGGRTSVTASGNAAPTTPRTAYFDPVEAQMTHTRAEAISQGWFDGCDTADKALAAMGPPTPGRRLDRLADVVPAGPVEGYSVTFNSPLRPTDPNISPWLRAGLDAGGAREGYAATFNDGPAGPGGWSVDAFSHPDPGAAQKTLRSVYTALVCHFGADPWSLTAFPGGVAASRPDTAQIFWTSGDLLIVVDWSVYQELGEAQRRAEAAAAAVRAEFDR